MSEVLLEQPVRFVRAGGSKIVEAARGQIDTGSNSVGGGQGDVHGSGKEYGYESCESRGKSGGYESCESRGDSGGCESDALKSDQQDTKEKTFGKFKDAEALFRAYQSLESEFTKKSQRLSALEKELASGESVGAERSAVAGDTQDAAPLPWHDESWQNSVDAFLLKHPKAVGLSAEIAKELVNESEFASGANALEVAYSRVLDRLYAPKNDVANDESFLEEYIYNNDLVKSRVIADYLNEISQMSAPATISGSGGEISALPPNRPKSVFEAGKMALDFFRRY
ncbi:MAG: hypothetical protein FWB72_02505 [Firmicutes bacterium]|nr:hypothetical protein [Bacillota bacterium]